MSFSSYHNMQCIVQHGTQCVVNNQVPYTAQQTAVHVNVAPSIVAIDVDTPIGRQQMLFQHERKIHVVTPMQSHSTMNPTLYNVNYYNSIPQTFVMNDVITFSPPKQVTMADVLNARMGLRG